MNANERATKEHYEMQRAFQEFMLTGGGGKKSAATATTTRPLPATPSSSSVSAQQRKNQRKQRRRSLYKRHQSALQDFNTVLVRDWLHVDDQLGRVVDSIANLRHRIQLITSSSRQQQQQESLLQSPSSSKRAIYCSSWKNHGYRRCSSLSMTTTQEEEQDNDLQLALNHSLLMHENMMATLRKPLLPLLHEAQETLGRRLQDFMALVVDECDDFAHEMDDNDPDMDDDDSSEWVKRMQADLQACQELYRALAEEVYRKQDLIQVCILDTFHDGLLVHGDDNDDDDDRTKSANWCSAQWSRQGKASALYKFQNLLNHIQQQQQTAG